MISSLFVNHVPYHEEKEAEFKDMDDFLAHDAEKHKPDQDDFIMVRSKVAPVLLPVHKGLLPNHVASIHMNYKASMGPPPGLPLPQKNPLPNQTYLDVTLPQGYPFHPADVRTRDTIASNALIFLIEYIWTHDPTAILAKFPSQANDTVAAPPIAPEATRNREFPNTCQTVCHYLSGCRFQPSGTPTKARIFLMHTKETSALLKDLNKNGAYTFAPCPIQAADLASTAWLLGSTEHTNCKDLTKALLQTPEFQARPEVGLLLRQRWVKLYHQERPSEGQQVFAVHISTAKHHYSFVLETLQQLYNRQLSVPSPLPSHGQYYAIADVTSYMAQAKESRGQVIGYRRHQKEVLRQCSSLKMVRLRSSRVGGITAGSMHRFLIDCFLSKLPSQIYSPQAALDTKTTVKSCMETRRAIWRK